MASKFVQQILRYRWEDEYLSACKIYDLLQDLLVKQGKWNWKHIGILSAKQKLLCTRLISNSPIIVTFVRGHDELKKMAIEYINEDETLLQIMHNLPIIVASKTMNSHSVSFKFKKTRIEIVYLVPCDKILAHRENVD